MYCALQACHHPEVLRPTHLPSCLRGKIVAWAAEFSVYRVLPPLPPSLPPGECLHLTHTWVCHLPLTNPLGCPLLPLPREAWPRPHQVRSTSRMCAPQKQSVDPKQKLTPRPHSYSAAMWFSVGQPWRSASTQVYTSLSGIARLYASSVVRNLP